MGDSMAVPVLDTLRVGFIGSGFVAHFHLQSLLGVRNVRLAGVYSPTAAHREAFAKLANEKGLGPCRAFESIGAMIASGEIDALWILSANQARIETMRAINQAAKTARGALRAIACEKPLARSVAEGREMLRLAEDAGLLHGYLENQLFTPAVMRGKDIIWRRAVPAAGRPYLARAAEEHSGPHAPWFWQGDKQGGGVVLDMMCHSLEVARYLLTRPGAPRDSLKLVSATGAIATLKWNQPRYVAELKARTGVDYAQRRPSEDFARGVITLAAEGGQEVIIEATTSWAFVGAGLRIQLEMFGPEYSFEYASLAAGLKIFMSRQIKGAEGEDLVEKQNAEQGLMPVIEDEAATYGYTDENRYFVECFRKGEPPFETFHDGTEVLRMLMALYRCAETGQRLDFDKEDLESYVPAVARV
jgi:predicted dehydrogenase